ncbi:P-loop containing nucleoside triphosphate hydrolase protein [Mrakia frigida]|uniref:uncharacterized protein n=1 Tax=Mrakia frigida TaxID=29902 RepID=UPI003FCC157A
MSTSAGPTSSTSTSQTMAGSSQRDSNLHPPSQSTLQVLSSPAQTSEKGTTLTSRAQREDELDLSSSLPPPPPSTSHAPPSSDYEPTNNLLLSIPPPKPYNLLIQNLTIGLPSSVPSKSSSLLSRLRHSKDHPPKDENEPIVAGTIVRGVIGRCEAGEVLAIVGGSGSGKTTLLNSIGGRLGASLPILEGDVLFTPAGGECGGQVSKGSGEKSGAGYVSAAVGGKEVGRVLGFVRQHDFLLPHLTVRETLSFAAALRLPRSVSDQERTAIVQQTIEELGLKDAADTIVGGALRKGISGGERRRLSIGCVLVTLPSVLILDEPTTGLDAFTSHLLLQTLGQLAKRGRTVVLSLHAPRSDAFALLDRLIVLSKGDVVYSGKTPGSLDWFSERGFHVEKGTNPLDFLIDVSSVDNRDPQLEEVSRDRVNTLVAAWKVSPRSQSQLSEKTNPSDLKNERHLSLSRSRSRPAGVTQLEDPLSESKGDSRRPGWLLQTKVLLKRSHLSVYRNYGQLIGFAIQAVVLGVLLGFTFFQLGETPADVQSLKNLSFQFVPAYFYLTQVYWIFSYCQALVIFDRENEDNLYSVVPYVVSEFIAILVPSILTPGIYTIILFAMGNLRPDAYATSLFTMFAAAVATQWATMGLALFSASIVRNFAQASIICNALSLFQTLSAGFVLTNVPPWVKWVRWIAPQFYAYRAIAPTLLKDRLFACEGVTGDARNQCDGNKILFGLGIDLNTNIGVWFAGLLGLFLVEFFLAILLLQFYHPGGVRVAGKAGTGRSGKESTVTGELDFPRARIDVAIHHLTFRWSRRSLRPFFNAAEKIILSDVSAYFPSGEVSAIIGPSGAGKSTILQLLAHRDMNPGTFSSFKLEGSMAFNGEAAPKDIKSSIAFVEQDDDYHLSGLTVRETLRYAALLRLPESMDRKKKEARAEEVLLMLGLKDCADVLVGGALVKGISGGEKRRLSLAVQLINDPSILVVDEPTSGLDSFIAQNVMQCLSDIAKTGRTVIATIHQPRSDIVAAFDNLCVLAKGGHVVFSGRNSDSTPYFEAQGYPLPSEWFNPADHILDIVSVDSRPGREEASQTRVSGLIQAWRDHGSKAEELDESRNDASSGTGLNLPRNSFTAFHISMPVVLQRMVLNLYRQREAFWNRLAQAPLLAALFILFYTRLTKGPAGAQDRIGVTLENANALPFVGLLNGIAIFPQDRDLFFHEYSSSAAYSAATFLTAYTLFDLSMTVMAAFLYSLIMHVGVGMQTSVRIYFEFAISIWSLLSFGESIAICFASFATEMGLAVSLVSTVLAVLCQISGIISLSVPDWLAGIAWITPIKPASKVQFINECRNLVFNCDAESISSGACVATSGNELLTSLGFVDLDTAKFMGIMVATTIAWRVIAWGALQLRMIQKR